MSERGMYVLVGDYPGLLRRLLATAAQRLGVAVTGESMVSASQRSIAAPARRGGGALWLRVSPLDVECMDEQVWTGNLAANDLTGVRKPRVLERVTWAEQDPVPFTAAAELMTFVPDRPVSAQRELLEPFDPEPRWWTDLNASLVRLAAQPDGRPHDWHHTAERYGTLLTAFFGERAPRGGVPSWSTEHLDLHWNNITAPTMWIIDWEQWGTAVTGYGAAMLYCTSLRIPTVTKHLQESLGGILDSPAGRYALLVVTAEMLTQATMYSEMEGLVLPLHRLADRLLEDRVCEPAG
jgi:hypothetical protein